MKKTMILGAAALAATMAMGVESSVVGYMKYSPTEYGFNNVGAAFEPTTATGTWTFDTKIYNTDATSGDVVMVLNPEIFNMDSYLFLGYTETGASKGWAYTTFDPNTGDPIDQAAESFTLGKGEVSYTQPADGVSAVAVGGKVEDITQTVTVEYKDNFFFELVNPFPKNTTLADLESFCQNGDVVMVLNMSLFNLDSYLYLGAGNGWAYTTFNPEDGEPIDSIVTDSSTVVLPAGQGGYLQTDTTDRTWTVSF